MTVDDARDTVDETTKIEMKSAPIESVGRYRERQEAVRAFQPISARFAAVALTVGGLLASGSVAGCKVVSLEEDAALRERASSAFDAERYVDQEWASRATSYWTETVRPLTSLAPDMRSDLEAIGRERGRQAGDGSPWVFVVAGDGVVQTVESGRRGRAVVAVPGLAQPVTIQIGPVVSGAFLRDSLPFIEFNDFANQLVYADVGQALNARAMAQVSPAARGLAAGDHVRFEGVVALAAASDPILVTPFSLERTLS